MIHKIVVVLDIEADSYQEAFDRVEKEVNGSNQQFELGDLGLDNIYVPSEFEHDEAGQRVLYLPPEDGKIIDRTKLSDDKRYFELTDFDSSEQEVEREARIHGK